MIYKQDINLSNPKFVKGEEVYYYAQSSNKRTKRFSARVVDSYYHPKKKVYRYNLFVNYDVHHYKKLKPYVERDEDQIIKIEQNGETDN